MSDHPDHQQSPRDFFNLDMFNFTQQQQHNQLHSPPAQQEKNSEQEAMLHQQLEHIHMQSPALFGNGNGNGQQQQQQSNGEILGSQALLAEMMSGKWGNSNGNVVHGLHGMPTPAQSSEMYPSELHTVMSPMQLGMLGRDPGDTNLTPLLSPALTMSSQQSPAFYSTNQPIPPSREQQALAHSQQLEQLQLQQRQFQEQLRLLQQQQQQLTSPYLANGIQRVQNESQQMQPSSSTSSTLNSPSPGYFSPLTSPALGPAPRQYHHSHSHSHSLSSQHPLSAISSPALNPVGSSGGGQQTLSPALNPQRGTDMASPDYLAALVGMLDNANGTNSSGQSPVSTTASPLQRTTPSMHASSPALGPNRHSLPSKSRPSPMMKPQSRPSTGSSRNGNPPPMSPLVNSNGLSLSQVSSIKSTTSTPSPVDLTQMMPPPPVPSSSSVVPMTPASLMNLGPARKLAPSPTLSASNGVPQQPARRASVKLAPAPAEKARALPAKRGLAIRPANGAARAPPRGAAVAARSAAATQDLPADSRKSSHKAAEQKRRDSLKAGFDELRLLLPPINTEALDPESGEPIPGSSAPRLLPKSSLVPDDNPNRGVSKVALLKYSNEYIGRLHAKIDKRDGYIELLREEVRRMRRLAGVHPDPADEEEDLLDIDMLEGEEEDEGDLPEDGMALDGDPELYEGMEDDDDDGEYRAKAPIRRKKSLPSPALGPRRPSAHSASSGSTVTARRSKQNGIDEDMLEG